MAGHTQDLAERMRRTVACVVPCYNAGKRVRPVVERLSGALDHVIVVDDGSTDDALTTLHGLSAEVVAFPRNRGKGHALLAGFAEALQEPSIEAICVVDADGQHDPAELPRLFAAFLEDAADLVIGARTFDRAQVPWRSRFGNRVSAALLRRLLGPGLKDTQSGFRILSRSLAEDVLRTVPGGRYETEMAILLKAIRDGRRVVSIPIRTIYESGNPSSHFRKLRDSYRVMRTLFRAAANPRTASK